MQDRETINNKLSFYNNDKLTQNEFETYFSMSLIAYGKERTGQDRGEDSPLRFHPVSVNIAVLGNLF